MFEFFFRLFFFFLSFSLSLLLLPASFFFFFLFPKTHLDHERECEHRVDVVPRHGQHVDVAGAEVQERGAAEEADGRRRCPNRRRRCASSSSARSTSSSEPEARGKSSSAAASSSGEDVVAERRGEGRASVFFFFVTERRREKKTEGRECFFFPFRRRRRKTCPLALLAQLPSKLLFCPFRLLSRSLLFPKQNSLGLVPVRPRDQHVAAERHEVEGRAGHGALFFCVCEKKEKVDGEKDDDAFSRDRCLFFLSFRPPPRRSPASSSPS